MLNLFLLDTFSPTVFPAKTCLLNLYVSSTDFGSPHCPFNAERQARKAVHTNFIVIDLTRLGIKPKSTAQEADALYHSAI